MKNKKDSTISNRGPFSGFATFFRRLFKEKPLGALGLIIAVTFILTGVFADQIAPYGINETDTTALFKPPGTPGHILGTDSLGRDLLSRVIYGARTAMFVGNSIGFVSIFIAIIIGVLSGYLGGKVDIVIQRVVDAFQCLPDLILLMSVISVLGTHMLTLILVLGIRSGIAMSRVIRGATLSIKENTYVRAAVATGCTNSRIILRHIIPNILPDIVVLFATRIPILIMSEASLSFLGSCSSSEPSGVVSERTSGFTYIFGSHGWWCGPDWR